MTDNGEPKPDILSIKGILDKSLEIPEYQRPYKWQTEHTGQLLDDLYTHYLADKRYRIGTLVLHKENKDEETLNVVDGQQRLTTLSLLLYSLGDKELKFLKNKINHSISKQNVFNNHAFIENYLQDKNDKDGFRTYILKTCEMVCITLTDLDEAFQFFDSQNSRGKALQPYDLLKAYHLRELTTNDEKVIHDCVENWEQSAENTPLDGLPNLDEIISKILFRLRCWEKNQNAEVFTGADLKVFKGVNADREIHYPYLRAQKAMLAVSQMQKANSLLYQQEYANPFNIQQTIINGENFFHFIQYYRTLHDKLFNQTSGLLKAHDVINLIDNYKGSWRTGDRYCKALFEATLLAFYDRFSDEYLEVAIDKIFRWAYQVRLEQQRVYFVSIENQAREENSLLRYINNILTPSEIAKFITTFDSDRAKNNNTIKNTELYDFFNEKGNNEQQ